LKSASFTRAPMMSLMCTSTARARALERRGHLLLAVHALLAQDRHARPRALADEGRRDVFLRVEREVRGQARVALVEDAGVFLVRRTTGCRGGAGCGA
jgi:hypothetical protein